MLLRVLGTSLLLQAVIVGAGCSSLPPEWPDGATPPEVAQSVADACVALDGGCASCSVAVSTGRSTVFAAAGTNAGPHAVYRIASLSKICLHLMAMRLEGRGEIDLDRTVAECAHLALPPEYASVTLRDLAEHRSGLPREFLWAGDPIAGITVLGGGLFGSDIYAGFGMRDGFVRCAWDDNARAALRRPRAVYSNVGYGLLGMALSDATGRSLDELLAETCIRPLKLRETGYAASPSWRARNVPPCAGDLPWLTARGKPVSCAELGEALAGAGGILSSASDVLAFTRAYVRELKGRGFLDALNSASDSSLCGTFNVSVRPDGRRVLYRSGMVYGGAAFCGYDPQSDTCLVILRNVTSWPDAWGLAALDMLRHIHP